MIKIEDKQLENEILTSESHIALPFELHEKCDGSIEITAYSFTADIAEEFERRFSSEPFSADAKAFLVERLSPVMQELGYDTEGAAAVQYLEYRIKKVDISKILGECELISTLDGEVWDDLELDDFELDSEDECDRMAVIRQDGKIVCYAGINDICEDDGTTELTVECSEAYRHRGFGASCIAMLSDYLIKLGEQVKYVCIHTNTYSIMLAENVGYTLFDRCLPFVCMRIADEDEEE